MKIFVLCPWIITGGPESIHQLCNNINILGKNCYIVYYDLGFGIGNNLYTEYYNNLKFTKEIEDNEDNIIIFPEVLCINIEYILKNKEIKSKIILWWLSYDYGIYVFEKTNYLKDYKNIIYAFQSHYAFDRIKDLIDDKIKKFLLMDYVRPNIIDAGYNVKNKENIVAINPAKDNESYEILKKYGINCILLSGMSGEELTENLQKCKIYIDFGNHPGRDRIPRESVALGCILITNNKGSANYYDDIPINEKLIIADDLYKLVIDIFNNYEDYLEKQHNYRNIIIKEELFVKEQIRYMLNNI